MEATSNTTNADYSSDRFEPVLAELVTSEVTSRSWVFRCCDILRSGLDNFIGVVSIIFCTAIAANIPIVQFLSFGYLLEVSGRLARGGSLRESMVGVSKASRIGGLLLGTWLLLIPIRFFSDAVWYESHLIDPGSSQTFFARAAQLILIGVTLVQIAAAWICGGKLRYFFWQLFAPFSFGVWLFRKMLGSKRLRPLLNFCFRWISPNLVNDLCHPQPPTDWFVPAILWKKLRGGSFYSNLRNALWDFVFSLNLWHYFKLGIVGFFGSVIWLFIPTMLLIGATRLTGGLEIVCGVVGVVAAIPVFATLLFVQTHFSKTQSFSSFFDVNEVLRIFRSAPIAHVFALLLALVLALPLFAAKIEEIPAELLWTLSLVFMMFSWPSRILIGLAYRRGSNNNDSGRWWVRWSVMALSIPVAAAFVGILSATRYVSWNGAFSMIENHVFLLPAPFWL